MKVNNMKSCAWKEFHGLNEKTFNFKTFKQVLMVISTSKFNDDAYPGHKRTANKTFTGAMLFCCAYDTRKTNGIAAVGTEMRGKKKILDRMEEVKVFIEEEGMGDIVEMPEFNNSNHNTKINSFMWIIDPPNYRIAVNRWLKDDIKPKDDNGNTDVWEV